MSLFDRLGSVFGDEADVRSDFVEEAERLADGRPDRHLDFTPESLERLDRLVDEQWRDDRFRDATFDGEDDDSRVFSGLVVRLGSYFGEVLVRNRDAEWVDDEDFGAAVRAYGDQEDAVVDVFNVAAGSLRESGRFAETYERIEAET